MGGRRPPVGRRADLPSKVLFRGSDLVSEWSSTTSRPRNTNLDRRSDLRSQLTAH